MLQFKIQFRTELKLNTTHVSERSQMLKLITNHGYDQMLMHAAMVLLTNAPNIANVLNMVSYLRATMHMGVAEATTTVTNLFAALQVFSIPAALLADSYVKRFYTVILLAPIEIIVC